MRRFGLPDDAIYSRNPYGIGSGSITPVMPSMVEPMPRPAPQDLGPEAPYGLSRGALAPMPPILRAVPSTPLMARGPVAPSVFAPNGLLGPIGGPHGIGALLPPPTVVPFKPQGQGTAKGPLVGQDMPLAQLVAMQRKAESSGNYQALNKQSAGNTASGAYQYTDGTWNNYGGYPKAALAPKEVQDRRFAEDIAARVNKYQGDIFKTVAAHYLPAAAGNPADWDKPYTIKKRKGSVTVKPVAQYLRQVFRGTPYENQLDAYIQSHK